MKKKNKSNLKFILILIVITICGIVTGFIGSSFSIGQIIYDFFVNLQKRIDRNIFLIYISFILVVDLAALFFYIVGKKKVLKDLKKDDGIIDEKYLSIAMGLTSIGMIVPLILLPNFYKVILQGEYDFYKFLIVVGLFFANTIYLAFMQSVLVNFLKYYNPEKYDNVLDMKFTKKIMATMDERELFETYKASFKAYKVMMGTIIGLIFVIGIVSINSSISLLSIYVLGLVFLVGSFVYIIEAIKN